MAFVPHPLPPSEPPLQLPPERLARVAEAEKALAQLELAAELVPSVEWFLYAFVRKEAVLSSRIEGTQASLVDLLSFEANQDPEASPSDDLGEVCNYLEAIAFAREELQREGGLPISTRLINEVHRRLMTGARGANKRPGEVRQSQNWIGGTRPGNAVFVPPPPEALPELLSDLERYVHSDDDLPSLVRIGLIHAQFETLHPYLDGNGRTGRMLITLLLEDRGLLSQPLLYLSLYFMRHRQEYYRRLDSIRVGDWEGWTDFFLEGVATIATESVATARELYALVNADRTRVLAADTSSVMGLRLLEQLPQHPVVSAGRVTRLLDTSAPTAHKAIELLEGLGVLREVTGRRRDRTYRYEAYLDRLGAGEE